jgi:hypothetical protein
VTLVAGLRRARVAVVAGPVVAASAAAQVVHVPVQMPLAVLHRQQVFRVPVAGFVLPRALQITDQFPGPI